MTEPLLRANLLMQQGRWELAERELRRALAEESDDAEAHRMLAACLSEREQYPEAESEARVAIALAPDDANAHLMLGAVLHGRRRVQEAAAAVAESLRLDPYNATAFGLQAQLAFSLKDWQATLNSANQGLAVDPDDVHCNNLRALALVKLGRRSEAGQTIDATLSRNPDDPLTHSNQGWTLLQAGDRRRALEHFREALRLDPNQAWAQQGIVEALKSKNIIYRMLLGYFFFMSRLSDRTQWLLIVGLFVLQYLVRSIANSNREAGVYLWPLLGVYIVFALMTWIGYPLFNLLLYLDKFGRLALFHDQRKGAMTLGAVLLTAISLLGLSWLLPDGGVLLAASLYIGLLAIPSSAIFQCSTGGPRTKMLGITLVLAVLAVAPLLDYVALQLQLPNILPIDSALEGLLLLSRNFFFFGVVGSQFAANHLMQVVPTR